MENKVTLEGINSKIKGETYIVLPDGRTTLCILDLENGYTIKGLSACVDPANFDLTTGRKFAREDAVRQIWPLEGYLLQQRLYELGQATKDAREAVEKWSATQAGRKVVAKRVLRKRKDA